MGGITGTSWGHHEGHHVGTLWGNIMGGHYGGTLYGYIMGAHHGVTLLVLAAGSGWLSSVRGHPTHTPRPHITAPHRSFLTPLLQTGPPAPSPRPTPTSWRGDTRQPSPPMSPSQCPPSPSAAAGDSPQRLHTATSTSHPGLGTTATDGWSRRGGGSPGPPSQPLQGEGLVQPQAQPAHGEDLRDKRGRPGMAAGRDPSLTAPKALPEQHPQPPARAGDPPSGTGHPKRGHTWLSR